MTPGTGRAPVGVLGLSAMSPGAGRPGPVKLGTGGFRGEPVGTTA
jgi:hypothetical protein